MLAFFCTSKQEEFTVILHFRPLFALLLCILNFVCALLTTLENFFVIYALWKASSITFSLRKLFLSLAFTDLAVGLCVQPMLAAIMVLLLARAARENYNFDFVCPSILTVNAFFAYALLAASFFTIAAIALDRFIAVTLHLRYQELVTDTGVNIAIVIIWFTSGLASFALIAISSNNYLSSVVIQILGLSVLTVAYFRIYRIVRHHQNQIQNQHQIQNGQAMGILREKKSALNALYVYIISLICYLPNIFASILLTVDNSEKSFLLVYYSATFLLLVNSALNPLVYSWRYREIRTIVKSTVMKVFRISNYVA